MVRLPTIEQFGIKTTKLLFEIDRGRELGFLTPELRLETTGTRRSGTGR